MSFLDQHTVLRVNANWEPLGECSVQDALTAMFSGNEFLKAADAFDIEYDKDEEGNIIFGKAVLIRPVDIEEWKTLPVRPHDGIVHTSKSQMRVPTVICAKNFNKMPKKKHKATNKAIWTRDKGICQVSGKQLTKATGNIAHLKARAKGGKNTFENLVLMDKRLNSEQGTKTIEEMGWKLIKTPVAPKDMPLSALIKEARHCDWNLFLLK